VSLNTNKSSSSSSSFLCSPWSCPTWNALNGLVTTKKKTLSVCDVQMCIFYFSAVHGLVINQRRTKLTKPLTKPLCQYQRSCIFYFCALNGLVTSHTYTHTHTNTPQTRVTKPLYKPTKN
jgi:hypothetical protein